MLVESMLADPVWWSNAYQELPTLTPGVLLHPDVMDFYLTQESFKMAQAAGLGKYSAFYLDRSTIHQILSGTLKISLRKRLLLPEQGNIPLCPVLFIGNDMGNGLYFLVLLDYSTNRVFLFGNLGTHSKNPPYISWRNPRVWKGIANKIGWSIEDNKEPSSYWLDWAQVCSKLQL